MSESKQSDGSEGDSKRDDLVQQNESIQGDQSRLQDEKGTSMKKELADGQITDNGSSDNDVPNETKVAAESHPSEGDSGGNDDVTSDGMLLPTVVRASAGTGKTYRLTARLMRILLQGAAPESILATTFTRKAAGEILDRVLLTLAHAANESDPAALEALREQVDLPTLPRSACLQMFDKLLRNVHRLRICTLDSLFSQLARSFSFELGLPPAWRLTDEIEEMWLREQAVDALIATLDPAEMMALLSMLGKGENRRSIARELLQVVDTAYSGQRQCGLKVWEKLAAPKAPSDKDLAEAVLAMRSVQVPQKRLMTRLEKLAQQIETKDFGALADDTLIANIASARRLNTEVKYFRSPFPEELDGAFDTLYAAVRTNVLGLLKAQNIATGKVLDVYNNNVTDLKQSARVLGFEDVSIRLASRFASLDQKLLGDRMDGAINHVLLDEFQDTSPVQWQVLRPLAMRVTDPETAKDQGQDERAVGQSFFCVGDTKQAIYGWRGGVAEIFDAVADQIPDVVEDEQNKSYRSSQVVVDVVNQTFKNLIRHPIAEAVDADPTNKATYEAAALKTFCRRFPEHKAFKQGLPGHVQVMTSANPENADSEARQQACYERAADLVAELNRKAPRKSIGILTRTNRGVAQLIFMLENLGVEVSQEGGNPLTDAAAVETILSTLMMAEHPGDGRWEFHARSTPLGELPQFGPDYVRDMVEERGLAESIEFFAGVLAPACDERETLRLEQLTRLAISYQLQAAPRLRDFVRLVREKRVERPQIAPVRVMTVHQSKGLEFDAVVLPELDGALTRASGSSVSDIKEIGEPPEGITRYLNQKAWHFLTGHWQRVFGAQAAGGMTEALCLLYVAMTRARQGLYIIMQPAKKSAFDVKTGASLVYHALGCEQDPTENDVLLYEHGDEDCWADAMTDAEVVCQQKEGEIERAIQRPDSVRIKLRTAQDAQSASANG
ncbi:MAG: UvrD-helicase domain-containing protein [Planctomycetaceae bacterium]|nr:UvrD-helicase domain-containing protein [Planctomycetaceae bacterium]